MVAPHAFGGDLSTQAVVITLVVMTTSGLALALYNIKRLQVDQHRAWMLRTWFYFGSIITQRIIMGIGTAIILSTDKRHRILMECAKLDYIIGNSSSTLQAHPDCAAYYNNTNPDKVTLVQTDINGIDERIAATLDLTFGMTLWLALFLHAVGVEIYLHLTPRESHRLREVAYQKQLEAGFRHPGSAGSTSDHWGDAELWQPTKSPGASSSDDGVAVKECGPSDGQAH
jgi:hypothetical protein